MKKRCRKLRSNTFQEATKLVRVILGGRGKVSWDQGTM